MPLIIYEPKSCIFTTLNDITTYKLSFQVIDLSSFTPQNQVSIFNTTTLISYHWTKLSCFMDNHDQYKTNSLKFTNIDVSFSFSFHQINHEVEVTHLFHEHDHKMHL